MIEEPAVLLEASRGWLEIKEAVSSGRCSQSLAVIVPSAVQETFVRKFGELLLGDYHTWKDGVHPDLIFAGSYLKAPTIEQCRFLRGELDLHPLAAKVRLAVIWGAEKLSVEASNSLLKLTEEPPAHGYILFIAEENKLIPTIKSRVWSIHIDLPDEIVKPRPHPSLAEEWAAWIESGKKSSPEILYLEIESWTKYLTDRGDYATAAKLESMVRIMEQKRLSVAMIQDSVYAVLKEGIPCEQIFGSLW